MYVVLTLGHAPEKINELHNSVNATLFIHASTSVDLHLSGICKSWSLNKHCNNNGGFSFCKPVLYRRVHVTSTVNTHKQLMGDN